MVGARAHLQTDVFGLGAQPKLARHQGHLLAGQATTEIFVGRNVDQAGLLAVRRRRPVRASPPHSDGQNSIRLPKVGLWSESTIRLPVSASMPFQTLV